MQLKTPQQMRNLLTTFVIDFQLFIPVLSLGFEQNYRLIGKQLIRSGSFKTWKSMHPFPKRSLEESLLLSMIRLKFIKDDKETYGSLTFTQLMLVMLLKPETDLKIANFALE